MYFYEQQGDFVHRASNASVRTLAALWTRARERRGALPLSDDLSLERLRWCADDLMLLEPLPGNDYRYVHYGANIARAAGFDMKGRRTSDFDSEVGNFFRDKYAQCVRGADLLYTVHQGSHAPGVHTWERLMMPLQTADGQPRILVYNRPLEARDEFLESVLASSLSGIIALAPLYQGGTIEDFQILIVNEEAARILGHTVADLQGQRLRDTLATLMGRETFELCLRVAANGQVERREVGMPGDDRVFVVCASRGGSGGVTLTVADVSGPRRHEAALRAREAMLRAAQRIAGLGSWEWDLESDTVHWSEHMFTLYGENPATFRPTLRHLARAVHADDWRRVQAALRESLERGVPFDITHRVVRADGSEHVMRSRGEVVAHAGGRARKVVGVSQLQAD